MNRTIAKEIILIGVFFCFGVLGTRLYGQVDQVDDINLTGFPTDETLLGGESRRVEKTSLEINLGKTLPKSLKEASVKRRIAEKEPMGNLHQMQKMSQYPDMDIAGQMKKLRALQWTGRGLWIAGSVLTVTGIIMASSASGNSYEYSYGNYWSYNAYDYYDDSYLAPLIIGIAFVGAGVPMDVVYTRRIKVLKSTTKNYSASLDFGNQNYGVGFGLHF